MATTLDDRWIDVPFGASRLPGAGFQDGAVQTMGRDSQSTPA